jgi:lipopolysaccharide transport protein LptA
MKFIYFVILFFSCAWISQAQTNVNTNGVEAILALVTTNPPPPSPRLTPARGPITIQTAGPAVFDWNGHWATYSDDVRVTNGEMTLTCEWLKTNLPQNGEQVTNIIAETNVVINFINKDGQPTQGTGTNAVYSFHVQSGVTNETITLTGNPPRIQQGQNYMTSSNIVYDLVTGLVHFNGPVQGYWAGTNSLAGTNSAAFKTNSPAKPKLF